ncbi:hypothetical protein [Ancylobacter sp. TS-1]|uniref:hypothetical protein n=1 Tax=Ancylobacter sp. TS-1 TaxID=1850374 RepID=UPI001265CE76|nr:hypothetical protein [Ancylobacter sp. TS-1]QFR34698.1 hypothetical protein GBB76_17200 [Ancylobacter sp. TS-1]
MSNQLPPGFVLDTPASGNGPAAASSGGGLPPGFVLDAPDAPDVGAAFDQFEGQQPAPEMEAGMARASRRARGEGGGIGMNAAAGLNEALYGTIGAVVDLPIGAVNLATRGVNALTGADIPQIEASSARSLGRVAERYLGVPDPANVDAVSAGEKVARGFGQGAGYMVAPELAVRGAAQAAGRAVNPYLEALVGSSRSPGDFVANTVIGGASGAGASAAGQAAPEPLRPIAEMTGGLIGGGLAAAGASAPSLARAGAGAGREYLAPLSEAGRERLAATALRDAATDPMAARETLATPSELVPGSRPTTFQQTGDMGLGALERTLETSNPIPFQQRRADQNTARVGAMQSLQTTGSPEAVVNVLRQNLAEIERVTGEVLDTATATARERTAGLGGAGTPEGYGATIRQQLDSARGAAKTRERELWGLVDPDGTLALDVAAIRDEARSIVQRMPMSAKPVAGEESGILNVAAGYKSVMPFQEVTALRSRVSDALREELSTNGQSQVYRRLSQLRGAIENALEGAVAGKVAQEAEAVASGAMREEDGLASRLTGWRDAWQREQASRGATALGSGPDAGGRAGGVPGSRRGTRPLGGGFPDAEGNPGVPGLTPNVDPGAYERLRAASAATKARAQTYDSGAVGDVLARSGSQGPFKTPTAVVPERFFRRGAMGAENMRALKEASNSPETMAAIRDYAISSLRKMAEGADGTLNPSKVAIWRTAHKDALRALPEIDGMLKGPVQAAEAVARLSVERKQRLDAFRADAIGRLIDAAPEDVSRKLGAVFSTQSPVQTMRRLAAETANNPEAREGLRKGLADWLTQRFLSNTEVAASGQTGMRSDQFQTFMRQNEAALRIVFEEPEVKMLKALAADLQRANRSITATKLPGRSNTAQDIIAAAQRDNAPRSWASLIIAPAANFGAGTAATGSMSAGLGMALGAEIVGRMRRAGLQQVDEILTDAILNPGRAAMLLQKAPPKPTERDISSFAARYRRAAFASTISAIDDGQQERQPLNLTVGRSSRAEGN